MTPVPYQTICRNAESRVDRFSLRVLYDVEGRGRYNCKTLNLAHGAYFAAADLLQLLPTGMSGYLQFLAVLIAYHSNPAIVKDG